MRTRAAHIFLVLLVCLGIYWPMLGAPGFASSEGHRVGPAWEMIETGDWERLRLFGLTYLRKPPGMPWAIAASSSVLGETEFAARAVSALASTVMALLAFWFTGRWLGSPWGLAGGLVQAVFPLFVTLGRTAEIDPLNALASQAAALGLIAIFGAQREGAGAPLLPLRYVMLGMGVAAAGVLKGPASLPVLGGVVAAACIQARSLRPVRDVRLWMSLMVAAIALGAFAWWFTRVNADPDAVTQDFSEFTWSVSRLAGTAMMIPLSFLAAFPASVALIVLLVHRGERLENRDADVGLASLLALSWLCAVVILVLSGSSNPRYAMPAAVLLSPLTAWALRACWMARKRSMPARMVMLGHPLIPFALLTIACAVWIPLDMRRPRLREGRETGAAIAAALPDGAVVYANDLVEARPDVLLYAMTAARQGDRGGIVPRWEKKALLAGEVPERRARGPVFLLLRADAESGEVARYHELLARGELSRVADGRIAKYEWVLLRVEAGAPPSGPAD